MTDQEALLRWLRIAFTKGEQTVDLSICVRGGMSLKEAVAELDAPLPDLYSPVLRLTNLPLSPHLGNLGIVSRTR